MYRMKWPGAMLLSSLFGMPLLVRVNVIRDDEAGVFVGTSDDLPGLVVEAESLDELAREVRELLPELMAARHAKVRGVASQVRYTDAVSACA